MKNTNKYVTHEEHEEIHKLVESLSKMCDAKIPRLIKKLRLKNLKKFTITVGGLSLAFECDDEIFEEIADRIKKEDSKKLDYFG